MPHKAASEKQIQGIAKIVDQCESVSSVLKILSHPNRLKLLCKLAESEYSVNDLSDLCNVSQSAMSQFLSRMKNEGIVTARREHNFLFYSID